MDRKGNKGFTLVELIVVIAIIAILMGMVAPNVPQIINRNRIKADMITAQQIGRAVRVWYSSEKFNDVDTDTVPEGKVDVDAFEQVIPVSDQVTPVKYSDIYKIEEQLPKEYTPKSFRPGGKDANEPYYGVYLTSTGYVARIIVTIQDEDSKVLNFDEDFVFDKVNYDGTKAGIAYVE